MNNRFKFRVWEHHNNKFSETPHGFCLDSNFTLSIPNDSFDGIVWKFTFQQFTGLLDKNGKEIYEGDIVTFGGSYPNWIVEYNDRIAAFTVSGLLINTNVGRYVDTIALAVIGNIFENPDLKKIKL